MEREHIFVRGEGGAVHKLDLPLHESIIERMTKQQIIRVVPAGEGFDPDRWEEHGDWTPWVPEVEPDEPKPPKKSAAKAEWVGWAVRAFGVNPEDAEAMTKDDLIGKYDRTPPA